MVKQPTSEQSEFTMSNEDFPALPGTQNSDGTTNAGGMSENNLDGTEKTMNSIVGGGSGLGAVGSGGGSGGGGGVVSGGVVVSSSSAAVSSGIGGIEHQNDQNSSNDKLVKSGVQTSPDGMCILVLIWNKCLGPSEKPN